MNEATRNHYQARADILSALGHSSRLYIIDQLANGERCVSELSEMVGSDMSTVSKHLTILRTAGLVHSEKRGNSVYYSLAIPCVLNFFQCIQNVLIERAEAAGQAVGVRRSSETMQGNPG